NITNNKSVYNLAICDIYICQGDTAIIKTAARATRLSNKLLIGKYNAGMVRMPRIQGKILNEIALTPKVSNDSLVISEKAWCRLRENQLSGGFATACRASSQVWNSSIK